MIKTKYKNFNMKAAEFIANLLSNMNVFWVVAAVLLVVRVSGNDKLNQLALFFENDGQMLALIALGAVGGWQYNRTMEQEKAIVSNTNAINNILSKVNLMFTIMSRVQDKENAEIISQGNQLAEINKHIEEISVHLNRKTKHDN